VNLVDSFWLCGCGFTAVELVDGARCICGLNPFAHGTWRRSERGGTARWRFVRNLAEPMRLRVLGSRGAGEVLAVHPGDLGSVCGRWTLEILAPTDEGDDVELWHDGTPYRFVRRGDADCVPWLATLMQSGLVYCSDRGQRVWMLLDAFTLGLGETPSTLDPPLSFLIGRQFAGAKGRA
jgi:hypothetical protein